MRNRISYLQFYKSLSPFGIFSVKDIIKTYPGFDSRRLHEWQQKNYITKLIKGHYIFNDIPLTESLLFQISNSLRKPSYISLESALSYYRIIPEQAFSITSVTTLKTMYYSSSRGDFSYKKIKINLFFGYVLVPQTKGRAILIADLEKSILDYLYLNPNLSSVDSIDALRLNKEILKSLNYKKMKLYLERFDNNALQGRYNLLKQYLEC